MVEIKVPATLKIGGFDYSVEVNVIHDRELRSDGNWGQCADRLRRIRIESTSLPQQFSETFLHEVLHAIDGIYGHYELKEEQYHHLGQGLLQVFEQLGIRFVK